MALQQPKTRAYFSVQEIEMSRIKENSQFIRSNLGDISGLSSSISFHGLVAPLVVRKSIKNRDIDAEEFELVSGYRRFNALKQIGISHAPCKVVDSSDKEAFELTLVENLQRKALDPLEEALSFQYYIRVCKWGHTKNLARKIGKSVEYINHRLKLLELPEIVLKMVGSQLTPSQAEELAWLGDSEIQTKLAMQAVKDELTVKQLHELALQEKTKEHPEIEPNNSSRGKEQVDFDSWLPSLKKTKRPARKQILENNVVALRFALSFMDNSIGAVEKLGNTNQLLDFMLEQRYKLHQVLDSFINNLEHSGQMPN
jgi:ParB family chromosome partitioning protein